MKIIGLDISTTVAGWCIFDDGELVDHDYYKFKKPDDYNLIDLAQQFEEHIAPKLKDADVVAIEDALRGYGRSTNSIALLIGWNAIVQYELRKRGFEVVPYHPSTAKKQAWGRGRAPKGQNSKDWVLDNVANTYNIEWPLTRYDNIRKECEDVADAITIARAYINEYIKN